MKFSRKQRTFTNPKYTIIRAVKPLNTLQWLCKSLRENSEIGPPVTTESSKHQDQN